MTFEKYQKIYVIGREENEYLLKNPKDEIIIEEKMDGGNARFMLKENRIIFGSRNQSIGDDTVEIGGNWKRWVEHVKEKISKVKDTSFANGFIFFGEAMVKHTMDYNWEEIPPYLGYDVLNLNTNKFVDYDTKVNLFTKLGLTIVPLIWRGTIKEFKTFMENRNKNFK